MCSWQPGFGMPGGVCVCHNTCFMLGAPLYHRAMPPQKQSPGRAKTIPWQGCGWLGRSQVAAWVCPQSFSPVRFSRCWPAALLWLSGLVHGVCTGSYRIAMAVACCVLHSSVAPASPRSPMTYIYACCFFSPCLASARAYEPLHPRTLVQCAHGCCRAGWATTNSQQDFSWSLS